MSSFAFVFLCIQACLLQNVFGCPTRGLGLNSGYSAVAAAPVGLGSCGVGNRGSIGVASPVSYAGSGYGASGTGVMGVEGQVGVAGQTRVYGVVPVAGAVSFGGNAPAAGSVSISGACGCGCAGY